MYKNILAPVDGSVTSDKGLQQAIHLAKDLNAVLTILHVIDEGPALRGMAMEGASYSLEPILKELVLWGKEILVRSIETARVAGVKVINSVLVEDLSESVADVIVAQAKKVNADLIVIGTHGRRGIKRLVMGSDAENVVRQAGVPVVLVRGPVGENEAKSSAGTN